MMLLMPLLVAASHLINHGECDASRTFSLDVAMQYIVVTYILILISETAGSQVAEGIFAPFGVCLATGSVCHALAHTSLVLSS